MANYPQEVRPRKRNISYSNIYNDNPYRRNYFIVYEARVVRGWDIYGQLPFDCGSPMIGVNFLVLLVFLKPGVMRSLGRGEWFIIIHIYIYIYIPYPSMSTHDDGKGS